MAKKKKFFIIIANVLLITALIQTVFFFLQTQHANISTNSIQILLRQEIASSNNFLISRTMADLQDSNLIKCARFINLQSKEIFADFTFRDDCNTHDWMLSGKTVEIDLISLNGAAWKIEFKSVNGIFFYFSLWLMRILFVAFTILTYLFWLKREESFRIEEKKKFKLKELASQAAHDVASPLTLLNALCASELVSDEVKELLKQAGERVQGIVGDLKSQSNKIELNIPNGTEIVDLQLTIKAIVQEFSAKNHQIKYKTSVDQINVIAHKQDLMRVISNILNNSIEASSKRHNVIEIKASLLSDKYASLVISDTGTGINPEILKKLSFRGATFGKSTGQGLGLYHAKECVTKWGGTFTIDSMPDVGTKVKILLNTTN